MDVTRDVVDAIAELAQLELKEESVASAMDNMTKILQLVEQMQEINTDQIEPMANPLDAEQTLRPDVVTESDQREIFQQAAPEIDNGLYLVPRVVE